MVTRPSVAASESCLIALNNTHIMTTGGRPMTTEVWILNWDSESWTQMNSLKHDRQAHACGMYRKKEIVVVGGWDQVKNIDGSTTEIFGLNNEWRSGGNIPFKRARQLSPSDYISLKLILIMKNIFF